MLTVILPFNEKLFMWLVKINVIKINVLSFDFTTKIANQMNMDYLTDRDYLVSRTNLQPFWLIIRCFFEQKLIMNYKRFFSLFYFRWIFNVYIMFSWIHLKNHFTLQYLHDSTCAYYIKNFPSVFFNAAMFLQCQHTLCL